MKKTVLLAVLIALVFSGCCNRTQSFEIGCVDECIPETVVVKSVEYIQQEIPPLPNEPLPDEYNTYKMKINNEVYYATDKAGSAIMSGNWESYRGYATSLRDILESLDSNTTDHNNP